MPHLSQKQNTNKLLTKLKKLRFMNNITINLFLLFLMTSLNACSQVNHQKTSNMTKDDLSNISVFISNFEDYSMDIQAAGLATIPKATISDEGVLYIEYWYKSGNENRTGKMTLNKKSNNRFEGEWKTNADNGNSYQGTLYFVFDKNGTAIGYYKFGGSDYKITILKK